MTWEQTALKWYQYLLKSEKASGGLKSFLLKKAEYYEKLTYELYRSTRINS